MVMPDRPMPLPPVDRVRLLRNKVHYCPRCGTAEEFRIPYSEHAPDWACCICGEFVDMDRRSFRAAQRPSAIDPLARFDPETWSETKRWMVSAFTILIFGLTVFGVYGIAMLILEAADRSLLN